MPTCCILYALYPTMAQADLLRETLERYNAACQFVVDFACANRVYDRHRLHQMMYYTVRTTYGLTAPMTVQAIGKAIDVCTFVPHFRGQPIMKPHVGPHSPMAYTARSMSIAGPHTITLRCLRERQVMAAEFVEYKPNRKHEHARGQGELFVISNRYYLTYSVDTSQKAPNHDG